MYRQKESAGWTYLRIARGGGGPGGGGGYGFQTDILPPVIRSIHSNGNNVQCFKDFAEKTSADSSFRIL
jgi:hypothetical protein